MQNVKKRKRNPEIVHKRKFIQNVKDENKNILFISNFKVVDFKVHFMHKLT